MAGSGPGYLKRVMVGRVGIERVDHSAVVVLLPVARPGMRRSTLDLLAQVPPGGDVVLGWVVPHLERGLGRGRRAGAISWGFVCRGHAGHASGSYRFRRDAAESCAVEAIDGPVARQRFDLERSDCRRPDDT